MVGASDTARDRVLARLEAERDDLVRLCLALGNLPDYPGHENTVADEVMAWLREAGLPVRRQKVSATSCNVIATLAGTGDRAGGGRSLILNAHMDTQGNAPSGDEEQVRRLRGAWVDRGRLYGRGLANDKAQLAATMIAVRAISSSGVALKEDLILTAVAQETSAPTDDPQALREWSGIGPAVSQVREGYGARWLVEHGVVADYALVAEVSDFTVTVAQAGYLRLRIAVPGHVAYTPGLQRGAGAAGNPNPFERAAHVIVALEQWARRYETSELWEFWGGTMVPKAQVYEVAASGPAWTETQDYCYVFFDVRITPEAYPTEILASVRAEVDTLGLGCEIAAYDFRRGYEAKNCERLLESLRSAHKHVVGSDLQFGGPRMLSMWRDANAFNEAGIPAIGYGPPTQEAMGAGLAGSLRPIAVDDLVATAKVIALTALDICGIAAMDEKVSA